MAQKRDYYEVLGLSRDADEKTIKKAFREQSLKYHPDRNSGDKASEEQFKMVAEAYEVLSSADKRRLYDQFGHEGLSGAGYSGFQNVGVDDLFSQFSDIFGDMFGFSRRGGRGGNGAQRGDDMQVEVELTYEEAASGVSKEVTLRLRVPCDICSGSGAADGYTPETCRTCNGSGQATMRQGFLIVASVCPHCRGEGKIIKKPCTGCQGNGLKIAEQKLNVDIPSGIDDGMRIRQRGRGGAGKRGGPTGDLYVLVRLAEHQHFIRHQYDLHSEVSISPAHAALGYKTKIPILGGEKDLEIPAGSQSGDTIVFRNGGFPYLAQDGKGQGSHQVHIHIEIPKSLTPEAAELYAKLAALEEGGQKTSKPRKKGFFQQLKDAVKGQS